MTARLTIVDDDPAFTDFLQTLLKTRGYCRGRLSSAAASFSRPCVRASHRM